MMLASGPPELKGIVKDVSVSKFQAVQHHFAKDVGTIFGVAGTC
jgi:hypothetical protein